MSQQPPRNVTETRVQINGIFLIKYIHQWHTVFTACFLEQNERTSATPNPVVNRLLLKLSSFWFSKEKYENFERYSVIAPSFTVMNLEANTVLCT